MDTTEIRRVVAECMKISPECIGVIKGDNLTLIATGGNSFKKVQREIQSELIRVFGKDFIHLGYIRFV